MLRLAIETKFPIVSYEYSFLFVLYPLFPSQVNLLRKIFHIGAWTLWISLIHVIYGNSERPIEHSGLETSYNLWVRRV